MLANIVHNLKVVQTVVSMLFMQTFAVQKLQISLTGRLIIVDFELVLYLDIFYHFFLAWPYMHL